MKLCLVTSRGGHLYQLFQLQEFWSKYDRFWVTLRGEDTSSLLRGEKVYYGYAPDSRNGWNALRHLFLALNLLINEKPQYVISCGAGITVPFFLIGKLMGIKTIYIEPYDFIHHPTLTGRLVAGWVDLLLVQHKQQLRFFKRAHYWGATL